MDVFRTINKFSTRNNMDLIDITDDINNFVKEKRIKRGSMIIQTLHTTMGLIIQELTEPRLCQDIKNHLDKLFPGDINDYLHNDLDKRPEVIDRYNETLNGKSHIQSLLLNQQLFLDIWDGKITLGKWQRIGILELDGPRENRSYLVKAWKDSQPFEGVNFLNSLSHKRFEHAMIG